MNTIVNEPSSPVNPAIMSAIRYAITAIGGVFVAREAITPDQLNAVIGAVLVVVPSVYGVYLSFRNAKAIKQAAPYTPDSIINSKP